MIRLCKASHIKALRNDLIWYKKDHTRLLKLVRALEKIYIGRKLDENKKNV